MSHNLPYVSNNASQEAPSTNRFVYVKPPAPSPVHAQPPNGSQKVLINPHFKAKNKVFLNPNFSGNAISQSTSIHVNPRLKNSDVLQAAMKSVIQSSAPQTKSTKIHINPNAKCVQMPKVSHSVHINPKFSGLIAPAVSSRPKISNSLLKKSNENQPVNNSSRPAVLTKTKLIRSAPPLVKKRRNSVKSKYKIIKSGGSPKILVGKTNSVGNGFICKNPSRSLFKVDNRKRASLSVISKSRKRYVSANKVVNPRALSKVKVVKNNSLRSVKNLINISGVKYRITRTSLRRTSLNGTSDIISKNVSLNLYKINRIKQKTEEKGVNGSGQNRKVVKKYKIVRRQSPKKHMVKLSPKKLKKCNIPCPTYRKYGICRSKENGKCFLKHDPDQIALCTRFLQGACIKQKCLLSHNVSPEKMPTCKYYLEGSCSRENCPYLHVKISPKAEVCREFLEGFCKKAAECDKRHQYLCPDYEKYGNCLKQRCSYPHGNMVRTYLIHNNKFAKKCSVHNNKRNIVKKPDKVDKVSKVNNVQADSNDKVEKRRYYAEEKNNGNSECLDTENSINADETNLKTFVGLHSRPKLGTLPAFIPFGNL